MTVLAAVNGERETDRVVSVGADLASALGEDLVALHVMAQEAYERIRESPRDAAGVAIGDSGRVYRPEGRTDDDYYVDAAAEDAATVAADVVAGTLGADAPAEARGRVGDPAVEVLEEADRLDASHLVIGGRKRSPVGKALFGSATQSILLEADCPVVAVVDR